MLKIFKNKRAQNTAEYAILIALVVGGVVAMQTYAQRTLQGRLRDASVKFRDETNTIGNTLQYEPYYSNTQSDTDKGSIKDQTGSDQTDTSLTTKKANPNYIDRTEYNNTLVNGGTVSELNAGF